MKYLKNLVLMLMFLFVGFPVISNANEGNESTVYLDGEGEHAIFDGIFPSKTKDIFESPEIARIVSSYIGKVADDLVTQEDLDTISILECYTNTSANVISLRGLKYLTNLETLKISGGIILHFDELKSLTELKSLDISDNQLQNLEGIESLTELKFLNISNNQLQDLEGIENLTSLESLYINSNKLINLEGIEHLTKLAVLDASYNQLRGLGEIAGLVSLDNLSVSNNQLESLEGIENLTSLLSLNASGNQLTNLKEVQNLTNLVNLDVPDNQLKTLDGLENVSYINISAYNNQIENIDGLRNLLYSDHIDLSINKISSIEGFSNLIAVNHLFLSSNCISDFTPINRIITVLALGFYGNPVTREHIKSLSGIQLYYGDLAAKYSTSWGDSKWTYDNTTQTMYIDGGTVDLDSTGGHESAPWYPYKDEIKRIVFKTMLKLEGDGTSLFEKTNAFSINLENLDVSEVTNMDHLFSDSKNLTHLGVSKWNTDKVSSMERLFYGCTNITTLDISDWDTKDTNVSQMFANAPALDKLVLGDKSLIKSSGLEEKTNELYTGKWRLDSANSQIVYDNSKEFMDNYDGKMPGIYIRERLDDPTKVSSITMTPEKDTLLEGKSKLLYPTVYPETAINKKVIYKSSDPLIARVLSNGKVQALSKGVVEITATTEDGGFVATSVFTVE
ncbi:leucine-rich repeat domain-containing protein [Enterococcus ureasiticus]|uniref:BIG2 domain-containing protein n=1 Tax=Enterococcus ureasiticus TaxID=903984 RepID=A0A1E5GAK6_9ENTE|nr:leucine-rich repeat domain-containing protein [Enterococcus ureasiticus]OEG09681.1 hypothetical protein BCR21_15185 [Enterococcus ureasiticus]